MLSVTKLAPEVSLSLVRFLLFAAVAALLILETTEDTTHAVAYSLFSVLLLACGYFAIHFAAQVLRGMVTGGTAHSSRSTSLGAVKSFIIEYAVPMFREADSECVQLAWTFATDAVTVVIKTSDSRAVRLTSFKTAATKTRTNTWFALRWLSSRLLRQGHQFQQAALVKACEEFNTLWLQLGQSVLPSPRHICALATAHKGLPASLASSRVPAAWMRQVDILTQQDEPLTCSHSDLEQAVQRIGKMSTEHAQTLVCHVVDACETFEI